MLKTEGNFNEIHMKIFQKNIDIFCNRWYYLIVVNGSRKERNGGSRNMKRYEWRLVNNELGCWEYYDIVRREVLIQTTAIGKEAYEKFGFVEG